MVKRQRHLLTDRHVRAAKPKTMPYQLADGGGFDLYVAPAGVKVASWRSRRLSPSLNGHLR